MSDVPPPQQTGNSNNLGSRNPFLQLVTPQPTGNSPTPSSAPDGQYTSPSSPIPPTPPPKSPANASSIRGDLPKLEPQRTGALNSPSIATPSSPPRIVEPGASTSTRFNPPTGPPPRLPHRSTPSESSVSNRPRTPPRNSTLDILTEELPPQYTPGPNAFAGEQTIDFGPVRPFQDAQPARPALQPFGSNPHLQQQLPGHSRSRSNPGSFRQALGTFLIAALTEPPRGSASTTSSTYTGTGSRLASAPYGISIPSQPPQPSAPRAPYGPLRPSAPTQPSTSRGGGGWSQYPGQRGPGNRQRSLTPEPVARAPDDGRPTGRPTPGHPLLRDGKVLVYPLGHECRKCFNKGFRPVHASTFDATPRALAPGDPSHPCKRCWRHYARAYTSSLAQLNWKQAEETNFQRPISDPDVVSQSSLSLSHSMGGTPGPMMPQHTGPAITVRAPPSNFGIGSPGRSGNAGRPPMRWAQSTPTGGVTYEPGDPRIGGRLCPRCRGTGRTRVFILETETCNLCQGIGRVF